MGLVLKAKIFETKLLMRDFRDLTIHDVDEAMNQSALIIRGTAITNIQRGSRSGRIYKRSSKLKSGRRGKTITHQASARGEFPKSDLGGSSGLTSSIKASTGKFLEKNIGSNLPYAEYLEVGTRNMDARPWLRRSRDLSERKIKVIISNLLKTRGYKK